MIYGRRLSQLADFAETSGDEEENQGAVSKRFMYLVKKLDHFWKRWKNEYLTDLRETHIITRNKPSSAKVGEVVLVFEDNVKRNQWHMGIIVELIKGRDGQVRGAKMKMFTKGKTNYLNRPLQKLYPLEVRNDTVSNANREDRKKRANTAENVRPREPSTRAAVKDARWKSRVMLDS